MTAQFRSRKAASALVSWIPQCRISSFKLDMSHQRTDDHVGGIQELEAPRKRGRFAVRWFHRSHKHKSSSFGGSTIHQNGPNTWTIANLPRRCWEISVCLRSTLRERQHQRHRKALKESSLWPRCHVFMSAMERLTAPCLDLNQMGILSKEANKVRGVSCLDGCRKCTSKDHANEFSGKFNPCLNLNQGSDSSVTQKVWLWLCTLFEIFCVEHCISHFVQQNHRFIPCLRIQCRCLTWYLYFTIWMSFW